MRKILSVVLSFGLLFQQSGLVYAAGELNLANYLSQARSAIVQPDVFQPPRLRYISYDVANNDFRILLDKGNNVNQKTEKPKNEKTLESLNSSTPKLNDATQELFNYFLIGLSLPNDTFWVNLRPDAPDNIIDPLLEKTDIGKIFLEADLQLKKDTASLTSPQNSEGKAYWDKLYKKAGELFGTENITIPTITRPWIVPNEVIVRETEDSAYIYKATLKVMLEADYLIGSGGSRTAPTPDQYAFSDPRLKELNEYSTQLIRETIIPKLTKEINSSKRYAQLRQVYYSLVLSRWFKQKYSSPGSISAPEHQSTGSSANSYLSLIDSGNLANLASQKLCDKQTYFQAYQKSFKDGEYNLQETVATPFGQSIRSYISGGLGMGFKYKAVNSPVTGIKVNNSPVTNVWTEQPPATTASPLVTKEEFLSKIALIQEEVLKSFGKGNNDYYYEGGVYENDTYVISKVWRRTEERFPEKIKFRRIDGGNIIEISADFLSPDLFYSYIMPAIDTILPGIEYPLWQQKLAISIKYDDYKNLTSETVSKFNQRDYAKVTNSAYNKILPVKKAMRNGPKQEALTIKEMQAEMKDVLRAIIVTTRAGEYFLQIDKLLTMLRVVKKHKADSDVDKLFSSKPPQEEYLDLYILNNVFERLKEFVFKDGKRIHDDIKAISVAEAIQKVFNEYCDDIVLKLITDSLLERAQEDNLRSIEKNKITADKAGELIKIIDWLSEKVKEREGATPIYQNYKDNLLFIQEVTSPRAAASPLAAVDKAHRKFKDIIEKLPPTISFSKAITKFNEYITSVDEDGKIPQSRKNIEKLSRLRGFLIYVMNEYGKQKIDIGDELIELQRVLKESLLEELSPLEEFASQINSGRIDNISTAILQRWESLMSDMNMPDKYKAFARYLTKNDMKILPAGRLMKILNLKRAGKRAAQFEIEEGKTLEKPYNQGDRFVFNDVLPDIASGINFGGIATDIIVNANPLLWGNVLILPDPKKCFNQYFNEEAAIVALNLLDKIKNPGYKLGYNDPGAFASVNQLHVQGFDYFYSTERNELPVEKVQRQKYKELSDKYSVEIAKLSDWVVNTIVLSGKDIDRLREALVSLTSILHKFNQPFNIIFGRDKDGTYTVYVFPRKLQGPGGVFGTGVAFLELSGVVLFSEQDFGGVMLKDRNKYFLDSQVEKLKKLREIIYPQQKEYDYRFKEENGSYMYFSRPARSGEGKEITDTDLADKFMVYADLSEKVGYIYSKVEHSRDKKEVEKAYKDVVDPVYRKKSEDNYKQATEEDLKGEISAVGVDDAKFKDILEEFTSAGSPLTAEQEELINEIINVATSGREFESVPAEILYIIKSIIEEIADVKVEIKAEDMTKPIKDLIELDSLYWLEFIALLEKYSGVELLKNGEDIEIKLGESVNEIVEDLRGRMSKENGGEFKGLLKLICRFGVDDLLKKVPWGVSMGLINEIKGSINEDKIGDAAVELGGIFLGLGYHKNSNSCNLIRNAWRSVTAGSPLNAEEFIRAVKVIESAAGPDKQISYEDAFDKIIELVPLIKEGERIPSEWITDTLFYIIHNGTIRTIYDKSFLEMAIGRRKYTRDSFLNMVARQLQESKSDQDERIKDDIMSAISGLAVMLGQDLSKYEKDIEYIGHGNDYSDYLKKLNKIGGEVLNTIENPLGREKFNASLVSVEERLSIIIKYNSFLSVIDKARKIITAGSPLEILTEKFKAKGFSYGSLNAYVKLKEYLKELDVDRPIELDGIGYDSESIEIINTIDDANNRYAQISVFSEDKSVPYHRIIIRGYQKSGSVFTYLDMGQDYERQNNEKKLPKDREDLKERLEGTAFNDYDNFADVIMTAINKAVSKPTKKASGSLPANGVSSSLRLKRGGIDLTDRMLKIKLERVGSFASSALTLPEINNVEALDLDKEFEQIQAMASVSIRPSDTRILEFAAACYYRGEFDQRLAQVSSCIKAAHLADEISGRDSSEALRLATMLPDALYGG